MVKIPKENLYNLYLRWCIQRDQLNAHFTRFGSGFITQNNMREAQELIMEINQNLIQYRTIQGLDKDYPVVQQPLPLPSSTGEKTVPKYVRLMRDDNLS